MFFVAGAATDVCSTWINTPAAMFVICWFSPHH